MRLWTKVLFFAALCVLVPSRAAARIVTDADRFDAPYAFAPAPLPATELDVHTPYHPFLAEDEILVLVALYPDGEIAYIALFRDGVFASNNPLVFVDPTGEDAILEMMKKNPHAIELQFNIQALRAVRRTILRRRSKTLQGKFLIIKQAAAVGIRIERMKKELKEIVTDSEYELLTQALGTSWYNSFQIAIIQGAGGVGLQSLNEAINRDTIFGKDQTAKERILKGVIGSIELAGTVIPIGRAGGRFLSKVRITRLGRSAPKSVASSFDDIAVQATRNPGSNKVVLGKFSEGGRSYTKVGAHYEASYFKVENWNQVTKGMTDAEIWKINEAFLRQQLSAGKQVILSHNPATATGFFKLEVQHLERLGYRFVQDGWVWKAVR